MINLTEAILNKKTKLFKLMDLDPDIIEIKKKYGLTNTKIYNFWKKTKNFDLRELTKKHESKVLKKSKKFNVDIPVVTNTTPEYNEIYKRKSYWKNFTDSELNAYADKIFTYYRKAGFPYNPTTDEYRLNDLTNFMNYKSEKSIVYNSKENNFEFRQCQFGLGFLWSFFPWHVDVHCHNKPSALDIFNDDLKFKECIVKRLKYGGDYISDSGIRKALKIYGSQTVSNFRPVSALNIYNVFLKDKKDAIVYDPCSGFAGRLLGAISCNKIKKYIGCDPNSKLYSGYSALLDYLEHYKIFSRETKHIQLNQTCAEDFKLEKGSIDLIFTSPPYFNTEKYNEVEFTQSYIKYPSLENWKQGFLLPLLQNCFNALKPDGTFLININNVQSYKTLVEDTKILAKNLGFDLVNTHKYMLSDITKGGSLKYEPILEFKKE